MDEGCATSYRAIKSAMKRTHLSDCVRRIVPKLGWLFNFPTQLYFQNFTISLVRQVRSMILWLLTRLVHQVIHILHKAFQYFPNFQVM